MRYIKITSGDVLWGKEKISANDLSEADTVIDLERQTYFIKGENKWEPIPHN